MQSGPWQRHPPSRLRRRYALLSAAALRFPGHNRAACEAIAGVRDGVISDRELLTLPTDQLRRLLEQARDGGWNDRLAALFAGIPDKEDLDDEDQAAVGEVGT